VKEAAMHTVATYLCLWSRTSNSMVRPPKPLISGYLFFVAKSVEGLPSAPGYGTRKMIETVIWTK
jgi:hypothetical protein